MVKVPLIANLKKAELVPARNGYGEGLVFVGKKNASVVVLCGDLAESTRTEEFKKMFPKRFFEVGVAEQNMAAVASGMAAMGKIPFMSSYAVFSPGRNWEQIRTTIAYNNQNVKIVSTHAGLNVGADGATHQALEDIALMRVLPNMTVVVPCDAVEARKATIAAAHLKGPVYVRLGREKTAVFTQEQTPFTIGRAEVLREGDNCAIVGCGPVLFEALLAAEELAKENIQCMVIDSHTVKPLDKKTIVAAARECGCVVSVEEHQTAGGLGSAIAEVLALQYPVPMRMIGVNDCFGQSGTANDLSRAYGLTQKEIADAVRSLVKKQKMKCEELHAAETALSYNRKTLLEPAKPELMFRLQGGGMIRNIPELKKALAKMSDSSYSHHVSEARNDFAQWIKDVFHDTALAQQVQHARSKHQMEQKLEKVLKEVFMKSL